MAGIPSIGKDNYYGYYGMGNKNEHGGYWTSMQTLWVDKICGNVLTRYFARYLRDICNMMDSLRIKRNLFHVIIFFFINNSEYFR